ncbi:MAG: efflux RND transporter permease subunit [Myxococcaceae bacterium]
MFLSDISIKRPVFTTMVMIALVFMGVIGALKIGVDLFPDISFPIVVVTTVYPGAGPEEVEQLVTKPMEESVSSINGVEEVRSFSRDSVSIIIIQFKLEADLKTAPTDVRDKINMIRGKLPVQLRDPVVSRVDPTAIPIMTYAVSSNRGSDETRRIVEDTIKPKLESVDGVAGISVTGGKERELHVFIRRAAVEGLGLGIAQVAQQIQGESFDLPAGRVTEAGKELNVKTIGRFRSKEELGALVVASLPNGSQVHLRDVADIDDGFKEVRTLARLNGEDAVVFDVQKQGGTNTVAISDGVYKALEELTKVLPADVKVTKAIDTSMQVRRQVADLTESILFGGAMAILVIFIFMLDWRSTLISSLALPISVVTTFLVMWWLGFTFNMLSMLGLSLAIGLLIDDAVVVRENIYRHMERGEDPVTAARKGTAEIGLAVMATTFTIVAVFVPIAFMGGIVGRMFKQFGLTVAAAVLVSLFVSFTLDPMMSARVMKPIKPGHHDELKRHPVYGPIVRFFDRVDAYYREVLAWALGNRVKVALFATVLFVGSLGLVPMMGKEFVGQEDRGEFRVNLEMPAGTSLEEMDKVTRKVEELVRSNKEVRTLYTTVGPGEEANKAAIRVYITKSEQRRPVTQWQVQDGLRTKISTIPGLRFNLTDIFIMEGAQELPITLYVRGDDYQHIQDAAAEGLEVLRATRGTKDADMSFRSGKPETVVRPDRARAADLGVNVGVLAQTVRLALEGEVVAKYRQGDRDYDIRLQLSPEDRRSLSTVSELTVPATGRRMGGGGGAAALMAMAQGPRLVKLSEVASIEPSVGPATIERMNRQRQVILMSNISDRALGDIVSEIEPKLAKIGAKHDVRFVAGGNAKNMNETFWNMFLALAVAVVFIYFVLASQFESFIHPFTIMLALPLAIIGALVGLFLSNMSIGMPAMIGIVLLMGLVTKNAILLVDYTNELRRRGKGMIEALLEAGPVRLRPILMTSFAMVLGTLPNALGRGEGKEFRGPMAVAVIGGVIASTFLTLLVVPVVYTWMDRFTIKKKLDTDSPPEPAEVVDEPEAPDTAAASSNLVRLTGDKP